MCLGIFWMSCFGVSITLNTPLHFPKLLYLLWNFLSVIVSSEIKEWLLIWKRGCCCTSYLLILSGNSIGQWSNSSNGTPPCEKQRVSIGFNSKEQQVPPTKKKKGRKNWIRLATKHNRVTRMHYEVDMDGGLKLQVGFRMAQLHHYP